MSRTTKDKPPRLLYGNYWDVPGAKVPKHKDNEWHWLEATPSWWTRMMMNRPQRREAHLWEREVSKAQNIEDLEDLDTPNCSHKPHQYYW